MRAKRRSRSDGQGKQPVKFLKSKKGQGIQCAGPNQTVHQPRIGQDCLKEVYKKGKGVGGGSQTHQGRQTERKRERERVREREGGDSFS